MPAASVERTTRPTENESSGEARRGETRRDETRRDETKRDEAKKREEWWGARSQRRVVGIRGRGVGDGGKGGERKWNAERRRR